MNNPVQWIDPLGLAHTSGKWKDCGKGCRIRIDGDAVGDGRHLHWECKNGSGVMGEFGGMSHDEDYSSAPNSIKKCAKNMVSSQNQVKICHAKPPGYQLLMRLLQLVLQLAQGMLYIE